MTIELTQALKESILTQLENGVGLVKICQQSAMPSRTTVLKWARENEDFRAECVRARAATAEYSAEIQIDLVDKMLAGELTPEQVRVALSALQWRAAKLDPSRYGDKIQQEHIVNLDEVAALLRGRARLAALKAPKDD